MIAPTAHNQHYFLEHKEDVAFSFIHDESIRDVLERHGIDLLFFARHFGVRVVDAVIIALLNQQKSYLTTLLDVMQLFFSNHNIRLDKNDLDFLHEGFKKTFAKFAMNLEACDMIKIESMLDRDTQRDFFSIEEIEESKELIEDMEYFLSKISSEEISMADMHSAIEKCVIITETYGHLLSEKESCAFLSRKLLDVSVLLRSWFALVGEEAFLMVLESFKSMVALLLAFHEQALEAQSVEYTAFDTLFSRDVERLSEILKPREGYM